MQARGQVRGLAPTATLPIAAITALLLSTTALPTVAAITEGVALSIGPGRTPEIATRAPQQGQRVQAPADQTLEYVLPDGTTLTLAPGSSLTITDYAYDPDARTGALALQLGPGLFRIAGGAINNQSPIALASGEGEQACQLELANGTAVVAVSPTGATRTYLLFGDRLVMTSGGETGTLVRPGFQLTSNCEGDAPEEALLSEGQLRADLFQLNPGLLVAVAPEAGPDQRVDETDVVVDVREDVTEQPPVTQPPVTQPPVTQPPVTQPPVTQPPVTQPPVTQPPVTQPPLGRSFAGALDPGADLGVGPQLGSVNTDTAQTTRSASVQGLVQGVVRGTGDTPRNPGLTTQILFNSMAVDGTPLESGLGDDRISRIPQRFFLGDGGILEEVTPLEYAISGSNFLVRFRKLTDQVETKDPPFTIGQTIPEEGIVENITIAATDTDIAELEADTRGASAIGPIDVMIFQGGFPGPDQFEGPDRSPDNFIILEARPREPVATLRDRLQAEFLVENGQILFRSTRSPTAIIDGAATEAITTFLPEAVVRDRFPAGPESDFSLSLQDEVLVRVAQILTDATLPLERLSEIEQLTEQQITAITVYANTVIESESAPDRTERFVFAAGDVGSDRDQTFTVDKFFISPGLTGLPVDDEKRISLEVDGPMVAEGIRAFLRGETAFRVLDDPNTSEDESRPGMVLNDTGVLIVNIPAGADPDGRDAQIALLHGDFGLDHRNDDPGSGGEDQGPRGEQQRSTVSITIGDVKYGQPNPQTEGIADIPPSDDEVLVSAHTFGSSRDNTNETPSGRTPASTFISSELFNTAAGGGNPDLGVDTNGDGKVDVPFTGRVGYIVFENFRPEEFVADEQRTGGPGVTPIQPPTGGVEDPVDPLNEREEEQRYAILRLGTAVGSLEQARDADLPDPDQVNARTEHKDDQKLEGFAAGIGEFQAQTDIGITPVDAGDPEGIPLLAPNLEIETDPATNKLAATLRLAGLQTMPVTLGGLGGEDTHGLSAFVDDDTFAARTAVGNVDGEYAMITALPLTTPGAADGVRQLSELGEVPVLKHVQWGFFLGERLAEFGGQDVREHVHLGAWAAGQQIITDFQWSGKATFEGVAVGNVFTGTFDPATETISGGNLSTAVGSYRNQWDFGNRSGSVDMSFDDRNYTGTTTLGDGARFGGTLEATGRAGRIDGTFVGKVNEFTGDDGVPDRRGPSGLSGQFAISETPGGTDIYRATGVVAADRKNK